MSAIQYPLINGRRHSFASIELKLNGQIFIGLKSINYSRARNKTIIYGTSPDPLGKTRGTNEYKADCELYLAEFNEFQKSLGAGYGDIPFDITVTYSENGFDSICDVIKGCTLDSTDASNSQSTDATVRKMDLNPIKILFNGIEDLEVPLAAPVQ